MTDLFTNSTQTAHARSADPQTSHDAARAITPELTKIQQRVVAYAMRKGPDGFTDAELEEAAGDTGSTVRSRRRELTVRNIILDTERRRPYGENANNRIVWVHRQFVEDAPPVLDAAPEPGEIRPAHDPALVAEARESIRKLAAVAKQMDNEGRVYVFHDLEAAVRVIERLIA